MNPYRESGQTFSEMIEHPWFPKVGDHVRIVRRTTRVDSLCDVERIGIVVNILGKTYCIRFEGPCPSPDICLTPPLAFKPCGRRLCHASAGVFLLEELGPVPMHTIR